MEDQLLTNALRRHALESNQIAFALSFREKIQLVLRTIRNVKSEADALNNGLYSSIKDWQERNPKSYAQYEEFQANCIKVCYSLVPEDFRLFPAWMDKRPLVRLHQIFREFSPFTPMKLIELNDTMEIESAICDAVESIDAVFPKP